MGCSTVYCAKGRRGTKVNQNMARRSRRNTVEVVEPGVKTKLVKGHWRTLKEDVEPVVPTATLAGYLTISSTHCDLDEGGMPLNTLKGGL